MGLMIELAELKPLLTITEYIKTKHRNMPFIKMSFMNIQNDIKYADTQQTTI